MTLDSICIGGIDTLFPWNDNVFDRFLKVILEKSRFAKAKPPIFSNGSKLTNAPFFKLKKTVPFMLRGTTSPLSFNDPVTLQLAEKIPLKFWATMAS